MSETKSPLVFLSDPQLAAHAASNIPAWLWSVDASRLLWGNPKAAGIFNAASPAALAGHTIDPKGSAALQIARLAGTLPHGAAPRLERLRGFGGRLGSALLCCCSRITLADRTPAILVAATEPAGPELSQAEQAGRLLAGCDEAAALFAADGTLLHATPAAQARLSGARSLEAFGAAALAAKALAGAATKDAAEAGGLSLARIGSGASIMLLATFASQREQPIEPAAPTLAAPVTPIFAPPAAPQPAKPTAPPQIVRTATERTQPLRFVWQMDAEGHFTLESEAFIALIGSKSASALGKTWSHIAAMLGLDPTGQVERALASHETWSGISVAFPVDDSELRLTTELSGLPVFDRDRNFRGYRGFGVCRDIARIAELTLRRRAEGSPAKHAEPPVFREPMPTAKQLSENVVPFRSPPPPEKPPTLTPVEHKAFSELASRLTAQLRGREEQEPKPEQTVEPAPPAPVEPPSEPVTRRAPPERENESAQMSANKPQPRDAAADQRPILDRLPVGVLVYRLDKLIYANRPFLDWTGYGQLHELQEAGGLDALFVEPTDGELKTNNGAKTLTIATSRGDQLPIEARLFTSPWEGESALVLMLTGAGAIDTQNALEGELRKARADADQLRALLDAAADGVVMLDREAHVLTANRGAETLLGYERGELTDVAFADLLAPESRYIDLDALDTGAGRDVTGQRPDGGTLALYITAKKIANGNYCVLLRDISPWKDAETKLLHAKREAERASSAKSDFLAKISHEIRTPLNAMIGFAEVMMQERFGPIGNDRYRQYLKDIHASGGHLLTLLNDLLDLSKIEAGKLELNFAAVDLNAQAQQCVALMQAQANRERVIIRTSLADELPPVQADARSVRQIILNILSNSIKFTGAGGQVIVSTTIDGGGGIVLRVRDTGIGMSEQDIAVALEPFRQLATSSLRGSAGSGLGLPLTKALAEANRARFKIKSAVNAGTLVEVEFPEAQLAAE